MAVTRGAAIYAAYLLDEKLEREGKSRKHLSLWDSIEIHEVTAHQLGIVLNGALNSFIRDGEPTPRSRTRFFKPTRFSVDGARAILEPIKIAQGNHESFDVVGHVRLDDIYTHGRHQNDVIIAVTFTAHRNLVTVKVKVGQGKADGSDYEEEFKLALEQEPE